jgi:flagellar basal body-associated protein FliL
MAMLRKWWVWALVILLVAAIAILSWLGSQPPPAPVPTDPTLRVVIANGGGSPWWKDIGPLLAPFITAGIAGLAVWASMQNTSTTVQAGTDNARAERQREMNQRELERLEALISKFHVPYLTLAEANKNMARDLKARQPKDYRLLVSLFSDKWRAERSDGDKALVREICAAACRLQKFIEENGGGVDPALSKHLARAVAHYRILVLAYRGKLGKDPKEFEKYVYTRELDVALNEDLERIKRRCAVLRTGFDQSHGPIPELKLPDAAKLPAWPGDEVDLKEAEAAPEQTQP